MSLRPKAGDRFVVVTPFEATVMTHWQAPFTGGGKRVLPTGLEFKVDIEPPSIATAAACTPLAVERWAEALVDAADRVHPRYAGYSLAIPFELIASHCAPVSRTA